ncbi:MFS transporter [Oceanirhabdus sp. W0125-5]|uniref:MFS transporter n=1 Tax=Oceanirhabdus sp. W0125-5 TaxID=2999116 RepID=UPI002FDD43A5
MYIKEIGYSETIVGGLLSLRRISVAFSAIIMAMLAGRFGRRNALVFGLILMGIGAIGIISFKSLEIMKCMSIIFGIGQSTLMTFEAPFLYSKSTEETRVHAFSASFSARNAAFMIGAFGTGLLADFLTTYVKIDCLGIRYALYIVSAMTFVALIPLMMIEQEGHGDRLVINLEDIPKVLNKKLITFLIYTGFIGFGAGMVVPFFGVYLRYSLSIADSTVGLILAIAQMGTVVGGLTVPLLAKRFGKVDTITLVQMGSIPFLILIGVPMNIVLVTIAFFFRSSLMNMAQPLIQNVYMEIVDEQQRPLVSSLRSTVSNLARAGGIMLGGYMMANVSYGSPYVVTILCYIIGTIVFRRFFSHRDKRETSCNV